MSRLDCEDGIDEARWEREMSRPIATKPARPTAVQIRALRAIAADQAPTCSPLTRRILTRRGWVAWGEKGRHLTAAGQAVLARVS